MSNHTVDIRLGHVDLSRLETDDDFRREAQRLLPDVLVQAGEAGGEVAWNGLLRSLKPVRGLKVASSSSGRREFIRKAGGEYSRNAGAATRREIEDRIIHILKARKERGEEQ